jgi:hypothetical protein
MIGGICMNQGRFYQMREYGKNTTADGEINLVYFILGKIHVAGEGMVSFKKHPGKFFFLRKGESSQFGENRGILKISKKIGGFEFEKYMEIGLMPIPVGHELYCRLYFEFFNCRDHHAQIVNGSETIV